MKKLISLMLIVTCFLNCEAQPDPIAFTQEALDDQLLALDGKTVSFQSVLDAHKGKMIVIDVWASWCRDCIVSLPELKSLQANNPDVVYLFLSIDKTKRSWKNGIKKYDIEGEHYFMKDGWNSDFSQAIDLDWVPRYMVIDKTGAISVYRAIKITDEAIQSNLNKN